MEVKWLPPDAASWQVLEPDGTIPSGVRFTVRVELPSPMYLYVAHRSADGSLSWLSPKGVHWSLRRPRTRSHRSRKATASGSTWIIRQAARRYLSSLLRKRSREQS